jgi:hypothetical protein
MESGSYSVAFPRGWWYPVAGSSELRRRPLAVMLMARQPQPGRRASALRFADHRLPVVFPNRFIIARDLDRTVDLLHRRADAIGRYEVPPHHGMPL